MWLFNHCVIWQKLYYYFNLSPEIMVTYTMFCNRDLEKIQKIN